MHMKSTNKLTAQNNANKMLIGKQQQKAQQTKWLLTRSSSLWCCCLLLCWSPLTVAGYFVDYTENAELIQQRAGYDVKLQCNLMGLVDEEKLAQLKIHWYFKQCSDNNCYQMESRNDWTALPCEHTLCRSELLLRNVTERYSGLYKCSINPFVSNAGQAMDVQLVRTYQLDVKNTSGAAPEFLDAYPANKSATVDSRVVFQCRVHSEEHPTIKWFRRLSYAASAQEAPAASLQPTVVGNFSAHIVRYNGRIYELLSTSPEKLIVAQIYLSKLIINSVQQRDEGHYACVAISYRGHKIREAYLEVLPAEPDVEYWADYDNADEGVDTVSDPLEFWLLFLMPLGLALLPLSVWLGYLLYKRCRASNECESMKQYSDEELDTERCALAGS